MIRDLESFEKYTSIYLRYVNNLYVYPTKLNNVKKNSYQSKLHFNNELLIFFIVLVELKENDDINTPSLNAIYGLPLQDPWVSGISFPRFKLIQ